MSEKQMSELRKKRGYAKKSLTRIESIKLTGDEPAEEIYVHLEILEKTLIEFERYDQQLEEIAENQSEMEDFMVRYTTQKVRLKKVAQGNNPMLQAMQIQMNATMTAFTTHQREMLETLRDQSFHATPKDEIKLPKLTIPFFSGNYQEFATFRDMFEGSVHKNSSLTNVQKFQHLISILKGDALNLIRHIPVTDANYEETWTKVLERYNREGPVITSLIKRFLDQSSINYESIKHLRSICDTSDEVIRGLKVFGAAAETRDPWLIHLILQKVDDETRRQWSVKTINTSLPVFEVFLKFLQDRCMALENCDISNPKRIPQKSTKSFLVNTFNEKRSQSLSGVNQSATGTKCKMCSGMHKLHECDRFGALSLDKKKEFVIQSRLCFNCLYAGHGSKSCPSRRSCYVCRRHHHTSLHDPNFNHNETLTSSSAPLQYQSDSKTSNEVKKINQINQQSTSNLVTSHILENGLQFNQSILPTAVVNLLDKHDRPIKCRLLLDSGSQATLVSSSCVDKLQLERKNCRTSIAGLIASATTRGAVRIRVAPTNNSDACIEIDALIIDKLNSKLPKMNQQILDQWPELQNKNLADPPSNELTRIDLLVGANYFFQILKSERITGPYDLIANDTTLGWIVTGGSAVNSASFNIYQTAFNIDEALEKFWTIEELHGEKQLNPEQQQCHSLFQTTTIRNENGRYEVRLPFSKDPKLHLGNSLNRAIIRLKSVERRLQGDESLKKEYIKFMKEYLAENHMIECEPSESSNGECFYLPHHPVIKPDSITTKVRVVFDGSAKTSTSYSLNDVLMTGPTIQPELIETLIRFRRHRIAIAADIKQMYRQVIVNGDDCNYQRIVWREQPNEPIRHFKLLRVTYGTKSASYLATRSLNQVADDNSEGFPLASQSIKSDFYVDDMLSGADSVTNAKILCHEIKLVLKTAGFELRKFVSNSSSLLKEIEDNDESSDPVMVDKSEEHKVLGLYWDRRDDCFGFKVSTDGFHSAATKRQFLSDSSRLFDPVGWLSPITVTIKVMFQQLWKLKLGWDDPLPLELSHTWVQLYTDLKHLEQIKIVRYCQFNSETQLHGFSDASKLAYSACIYVRNINGSKVKVQLVAAKTKVAPLKTITVPRLELCGAVLLAKLMSKIKQIFNIDNKYVFLWTDSEIVLHWLAKHPSSWKVFVANRCTNISELIPNVYWQHVRSEDNPADCASRGVTPKQLLAHELWWNGPKWLQNNQSEWPIYLKTTNFDGSYEESKPLEILTVGNDLNFVSGLLESHSSYTKIIRITAYILKFTEIMKKLIKLVPRLLHIKVDIKQKICCQLNAVDLRKAEFILLTNLQKIVYHEEFKQLRSKKHILNSDILRLNPFVCENGLLRVGGRLENSNIPFSQKHPIIIPGRHLISQLILRHLHVTHFHAGSALLIHLSRQLYWITKVRKVARDTVTNCTICCRFNSKPQQQQMGILPASRVTPASPFHFTGLDYAGPITINSKNGRGAKPIKAYVVVFICMSIKAIHLELVTDATTDSFINALKRFVSRRGLPKEIHSDNGTNFLGAQRKLDQALSAFIPITDQQDVQDFVAQRGITWKFIPPAAPNFGGLWESAVKMMKRHLYKSVGNTKFCYEDLNTILCQIEAVMNSRPITPVTEDPEELLLTPADFLNITNLMFPPAESLINVKENYLNHYQLIQRKLDMFWKRFSAEYLNHLQERFKWQRKFTNIQIGDLVYVKSEDTPPLSWPIAKVVELHPGQDGVVRVITIQNSSKSRLKRPVSKLVRIPIREQVPNGGRNVNAAVDSIITST